MIQTYTGPYTLSPEHPPLSHVATGYVAKLKAPRAAPWPCERSLNTILGRHLLPAATSPTLAALVTLARAENR